MTEHLGVRELRGDLAAQVRRAATGHRVVVTVGGRAAATLGPVETALGGQVTLDALCAAGLAVPPRRLDAARKAARLRPPVPVWSGVRLDRALRELRG